MLSMIGKLLSSLARIDLSSTRSSTNVSTSTVRTDFGMIEVQLQDETGNWRTFSVTQNIPPMIIAAEKQLASQFPGKRVRAVDSNGRLVDIL